jgi:hypothetical protein
MYHPLRSRLNPLETKKIRGKETRGVGVWVWIQVRCGMHSSIPQGSYTYIAKK